LPHPGIPSRLEGIADFLRSVQRAAYQKPGVSRMQSSADVLKADQATTERVKHLLPFGLAERQARFLASVMLHSGVFVRRQYAAFAGITHGQKVHDFIEKLIARKFVTPIELGSTGRARIFHVHHKPLYTAIGEPDNRNRRRVTIVRAVERLMILDGVLADRSVTWLGSEREKCRYFKQRLGNHLRDDEYPRLVFGKRPNVTVRYFPDKLPIGHDGDHRRHLFMYLARSASSMDFRVFILRSSRAAQRVGLLDHSSLVPEAARRVGGGVRERSLRAPYGAVDAIANQGVDLVLATTPAHGVGRVDRRSGLPAGSSKSLSQPEIRRNPPALDRGGKPRDLSGGVTGSSRRLGPSPRERRVPGAASCLRASLCSCAASRTEKIAKQGG
jgi:hypothetical protein